MSIELKKISTEARNPNTLDIDLLETKDILKKINDEDKKVAYAVEEKINQITKVVDEVYNSFLKGGRLIYLGAGTSGRIGIVDSVECPPTFGVDYDMVQCLMAGGRDAFVKAKEGAEDDANLAGVDLANIKLTKNDFVIGIAASGRTPYVIGGIEYAKKVGCLTGCITTSQNTILASLVDYPIEVITGAEVITGSTRMKSGTAQKMVCNMISTSAMIKMGKVYSNLMIDVKTTNEKLVVRGLNIIKEITGYSDEVAKEKLKEFGTIKNIIFNYFTKENDVAVIEEYLKRSLGNIRKSIELYEGERK